MVAKANSNMAAATEITIRAAKDAVSRINAKVKNECGTVPTSSHNSSLTLLLLPLRVSGPWIESNA